MMARPGRLPREEQTLPPNIQRALAARASGSNWNDAAEVGNITPANLRKWRLGLDRNTRPYAAIQAISESFKILSTNIADRENREELKTIKAALDRLEGVNTVDIYAESES